MANRDDASTHVLEAVLLSFILLGAAFSVTTLRGDTGPPRHARINLEVLAGDAIRILDGLETPDGKVLDIALLEAIHCVSDPVPSVVTCDGTRAANMSLRLVNYLPSGSGYAYGFSNGVGQRILYRSVLPGGETVSATRAIVPDWNMTFVLPDMSCYPAGQDVRVAAIPIWHGMAGRVSDVNLTAQGVNVTATDVGNGRWNATFLAVTRPPTATIQADVNATTGTYAGAATYAACDLGGNGLAIAAALLDASFTAAPSAPIGGNASFTYDIAPFTLIPGVSLQSVSLVVYEPLAPRADAVGTYIPRHTAALGAVTSGTTRWDVPSDSIFGIHPSVLNVTLTSGGNSVSVYLLALPKVALHTGEVPIDPPYRFILQAWLPDG